MTDRPIIFSGSMVKALLDGRKTMTRRIINPQPTPFRLPSDDPAFGLKKGDWSSVTLEYIGDDPWPRIATGRVITRQEVRFNPGMQLWVREAWRLGKPHDADQPTAIWPKLEQSGKGVTVLYEAGGWRSVSPAPRAEPDYPNNEPMPSWAGRRRASLHMPRWASRLTLTVTDVKIERLQEIAEVDAQAEGAICVRHTTASVAGRSLPPPETWCYDVDPVSGDRFAEDRTASGAFELLWMHLHGRDSWDANPWIVALRFSVERRNIDAVRP